MATSEKFLQYIEYLGLFRWKISETPSAWEAILSAEAIPNKNNFTSVLRNEDGTYHVRLAKVDMYNVYVTEGFFKLDWNQSIKDLWESLRTDFTHNEEYRGMDLDFQTLFEMKTGMSRDTFNQLNNFVNNLK